MSDSVVIVGGGIAGQAVCEALRERDPDAAITLVCGETSAPYDRVRLSEILVSGEDPETLQLRPAEWYADHDVDLELGRRVTAVDVRGAHGRVRRRPHAAATTGSCSPPARSPLMPPISGIDLPGVHPFRGPEDCEAIRTAAAAGGARHAAVIGGGLLGLEAARGIAAQGCDVTVVHLLDRLMERQLDAGAAALLAPALAALDVAVLLRAQHDRDHRPRPRDRPALQGRRAAARRPRRRLDRYPARGLRSPARSASSASAGSSSTTRCARASPACSPSASARSTAASSTGSSPRSTTRRGSRPPR